MTADDFSTGDTASPVSYPQAPWQMVGDLWLTIFQLPGRLADTSPARVAGVYGVAFVEYVAPSPLTYHELLVARVHPSKRVTIDQIWVDSPASMAGGRALWAIPKDLCDFQLDREPSRLGSTATWSASVDGAPIASVRFQSLATPLPRLPFTGGIWQARSSGEEVLTNLRGTCGVRPSRAAHWTFAATGPLGWLGGARQLGSLSLADFDMSFG